jgi:cytochrome P450
LVAEVDKQLGGQDPSFANVDELPYLHAVINETLRYGVYVDWLSCALIAACLHILRHV